MGFLVLNLGEFRVKDRWLLCFLLIIFAFFVFGVVLFARIKIFIELRRDDNFEIKEKGNVKVE